MLQEAELPGATDEVQVVVGAIVADSFEKMVEASSEGVRCGWVRAECEGNDGAIGFGETRGCFGRGGEGVLEGRLKVDAGVAFGARGGICGERVCFCEADV